MQKFVMGPFFFLFFITLRIEIFSNGIPGKEQTNRPTDRQPGPKTGGFSDFLLVQNGQIGHVFFLLEFGRIAVQNLSFGQFVSLQRI